MGKRGPPPKPTAMKELEGTYRPDRAPKNEVKPDPATSVTCPKTIARDKDAKRLWDDLAPRLLRLGLFTELDGPDLQGLCQAYSKAVKCDRAVLTYGVITKTEFGIRANPAVQMSRAAWAEVRRFASMFGMSPSDRTRVDVEPGSARDKGEGEPQGDAAADFLFEKKVAGHIGRK